MDGYSTIIDVTFGSYTFILNDNNEWVSNNAGIDSSSATMSFTPSVDGTLMFDVVVSSEANWDKFNYAGNSLSGEDSASVTIEMSAGLTYQISYSKDGSGSGGNDNAVITNLRFSSVGVNEGIEYFVLSFDTNGGNSLEPVVGTNSTDVDCMPADPVKDNYAFDGWYLDADLTNEYNGEPLTENTTVYAKWVETKKITLVLSDELDNQIVFARVDEIPELPSPNREKYKFEGWYTTETFEAGTEYVPTLTTNDIVLYAKWSVAPAYCGTYFGYNVYGESSAAINSKQTLTIDYEGVISGHRTGVVVAFDEETGIITWKDTKDSETEYYMYYANGVIAYAYNKNNDLPYNDIFVFVKENISSVKTMALVQDKLERIVEFTTDDNTNKIVFVKGNEIFADVVLTNMDGDNVSVADLIAKNVSELIIYDKDGNIVGSYAKNGSYMSPMDGNQGTYTNGENTLVLNGVDKATLNTEEGTYEVKEGYLAVYVNNTYYEVTLDKGTMAYEIEMPMVTIEFNAGDLATVETKTVNKNIEVTLPEPTNEAYIFRGWYLDAEHNNAVSLDYIPTESVTLYAKWDAKVTLTIVYGNDLEDLVLYYGIGDVTEPVVPPVTKGMAFEGWYLDAEFETPYTIDEITENTIIYCNWQKAHAMYGDYTGIEIYYYNESGTSPRLGQKFNITIDAYGKISGSSSHDGTITSYDPETGVFNLAKENSYNGLVLNYFGVYDATSGVIAYAYNTNTDTIGKDFYIILPCNAISIDASNISYWDSNCVLMTVTLDESTTVNIFKFRDEIYYDVTFTSTTEGVTAGNASTYEDLKIFDSTEKLIAEFAHDGTTLKYLDGNQGTYTNGENTLVLNGVDKATLNTEEGTYEVKEGYLAVYVNNTYYEVTLDKGTMAYEIEMPMVTIEFNAGDLATVETKTVNKNIEVTLPEPTNEAYIFRGWYLDAEHNNAVSLDYIPTESVTLYAKWDAKVTLTIVYGNDLEDLVLYYGIGDVTEPVVPPVTKGMAFEGWYLDAEFETPYTIDEITENTIIYCNWQKSVVYCGNYVGVNVYGNSASGSTISGGTWPTNLVVDATGNVSGHRSGKVIEYDELTGTFILESGTTKYNGYYDAENGILVYAYNSGGDSMGSDIYIFFKDVTSLKTDDTQASYWNSGYTKLMTFDISSNKKVDVLFYNDKIYYDVTFASTTEGITTANAYTANDLVVYDANGEIIVSFVAGTNGLEVVEN